MAKPRFEALNSTRFETFTDELWDDMREDTRTLISLMDPLLRMHGYILRPRWTKETRKVPRNIWQGIHIESADPIFDKQGEITGYSLMAHGKAPVVDESELSEVVFDVLHWTVQSIGPATLDIICHSDEELFCTVVSILFPDRFVDYLRIAIDLSHSDSARAYYRNKINQWGNFKA